MYRYNYLLAIWICLLNLFQFILLPLYLLPISPYFTALLIPIALFNNMHWSLIHEGIHGVLHPNPKINKNLSRVLTIALGSSFRIVRLGHLMHHKYDPDRPEFYNKTTSNSFKAQMSYFFQLLGGLYLIEIVVPILFFLPKKFLIPLLYSTYKDDRRDVHLAKQRAAKGLSTQKAIQEIRADALMFLLLFGTSLFLYGQLCYWFFAILVARGFLISFMDNIYHYATPIAEKSFAHNIKLPSLLQALILNANHHGFHHHYPKVPWYELPKAFKEKEYAFQIDLKKASKKQFEGAIEDPNLGLLSPQMNKNLKY